MYTRILLISYILKEYTQTLKAYFESLLISKRIVNIYLKVYTLSLKSSSPGQFLGRSN